ncbi:MAG TPA: ABC transporter permease subunit [Candidatus Alectryocaccomicrobium excrementavium]|uniref:ABC transporter permease subunit n=1 Tax=Candidatus Alectryocaccomicrobium excrementavium TaxID=2840668 RepID=A0A9D1G0Q1_9FIRM|nr:ABC transporter permease subunit [Candidatus Alectryocaccomicrobium excrementavium]
MRISTTCRNRIIRVLAVAFWIAVWQGVSLAVGSEILVASPARTFGALLSLLREGAFYRAVLGSLMRICAGFALALALGIALGALSFAVGWVRALLHPVVSVVKATPVASFVILALIWISSKNLSIFISFLMVFPIMYENMLAGLESADPKLLEMGRVFQLSRLSRIRAIYLPAAYPFLLSAARLSLGMCWKSGIAAEVIGQPRQSIGAELNQAKLFFNTPDLFAWTVTIIVVSVVFERLVLCGIRALMRRWEHA